LESGGIDFCPLQKESEKSSGEEKLKEKINDRRK
jgi:hypothetical protein